MPYSLAEQVADPRMTRVDYEELRRGDLAYVRDAGGALRHGMFVAFEVPGKMFYSTRGTLEAPNTPGAAMGQWWTHKWQSGAWVEKNPSWRIEFYRYLP